MSLGTSSWKSQFLHPQPSLPPVIQKTKDPQHAFSVSSVCADTDLRSRGARARQTQTEIDQTCFLIAEDT